MLDAAGRPLVEGLLVLGGAPGEVPGYGRAVGAVACHQLEHEPAVDEPGIELRPQGGEVAFLPVPDDVGEERRCPGHPALEEGEVHPREAPRDATEKEGLGQRLLSRRQHGEVVVDVARDRAVGGQADEAGVEGDRHPELLRLGPHGVVVVVGVDAELVDPIGVPGRFGVLAGERREGPLHVAGAQHRLEPELGHGVLELGDRFLGCVHRDGGHGCQAVRQRSEGLGVASVEGPACPAAVALVVGVEEDEPEARVHHPEVDADLVEAVVEQPREQRRGEIDGPRSRRAPPRSARCAGGRPLGGGLLVPAVPGPAVGRHEPTEGRMVERQPLGLEVRRQRREVLGHVAVAVDHRMVEPPADLGGRGHAA